MTSASEATICAIATPAGVGGVGIVRVSGPEAIQVLGRLIGTDAQALEPRRLYHRTVRSRAGEAIDDALVVTMPAPRSFTGEDTAEIHGHGGPANMQRVLRATEEAGARLAEPGEFTRRAFRNGKIGLVEMEALADVLGAKTERAVAAAQRRLRGHLGGELREILAQGRQLYADGEADIDFPEAGLEPWVTGKRAALLMELAGRCRALASTFPLGRALAEGVRVVLTGEVNAGKSSLMNALLGEDRVLVSDTPGTTRDYVEATTEWEGVLFTLVDTAGRRTASDAVEREGIQRAQKVAEEADIWIEVRAADNVGDHVVDARALLVTSKSDLGSSGGLSVSVKTGQGIEELRRTLVGEALKGVDGSADIIIASARQQSQLEKAAAAFDRAREAGRDGLAMEVLVLEIRTATTALGEMLGEEVYEGMLDDLFARFCIGK